jgi:hypothetical protein
MAEMRDELPAEVLDSILVHLAGFDAAALIAIRKGVGPNQIDFPEDPGEEEAWSDSEWGRTEDSSSEETGPEQFLSNMIQPKVPRPNRRGFEQTPSGILQSLPEATRDDILNFSVVNKRCCSVFRNRFRFSHILMQPEEILHNILDYLTSELGHLSPPSERRSLSVESFASIPHVPQNFSHISELVSWSISAS